MPCCAPQQAPKCLSVCCHSVPQLPGQDSGKSLQPEPSHEASALALSQPTRASIALVLFEMAPPPLQTEPPPGRSSFEEASALPLSPQHAPEAHAGRAPPSL